MAIARIGQATFTFDALVVGVNFGAASAALLETQFGYNICALLITLMLATFAVGNLLSPQITRKIEPAVALAICTGLSTVLYVLTVYNAYWPAAVIFHLAIGAVSGVGVQSSFTLAIRQAGSAHGEHSTTSTATAGLWPQLVFLAGIASGYVSLATFGPNGAGVSVVTVCLLSALNALAAIVTAIMARLSPQPPLAAGSADAVSVAEHFALGRPRVGARHEASVLLSLYGVAHVQLRTHSASHSPSHRPARISASPLSVAAAAPADYQHQQQQLREGGQQQQQQASFEAALKGVVSVSPPRLTRNPRVGTEQRFPSIEWMIRQAGLASPSANTTPLGSPAPADSSAASVGAGLSPMQWHGSPLQSPPLPLSSEELGLSALAITARQHWAGSHPNAGAPTDPAENEDSALLPLLTRPRRASVTMSTPFSPKDMGDSSSLHPRRFHARTTPQLPPPERLSERHDRQRRSAPTSPNVTRSPRTERRGSEETLRRTPLFSSVSLSSGHNSPRSSVSRDSQTLSHVSYDCETERGLQPAPLWFVALLGFVVSSAAGALSLLLHVLPLSLTLPLTPSEPSLTVLCASAGVAAALLLTARVIPPRHSLVTMSVGGLLSAACATLAATTSVFQPILSPKTGSTAVLRAMLVLLLSLGFAVLWSAAVSLPRALRRSLSRRDIRLLVVCTYGGSICWPFMCTAAGPTTILWILLVCGGCGTLALCGVWGAVVHFASVTEYVSLAEHEACSPLSAQWVDVIELERSVSDQVAPVKQTGYGEEPVREVALRLPRVAGQDSAPTLPQQFFHMTGPLSP